MPEPSWLPTPQEQALLEDDVPLPMGYCLECHKEVVATVAMGGDGRLDWRCIFCDAPLLQEEGGLKEVRAAELFERGYRVVAPEAARLHKEGGMSEPGDAGGCGSCSGGGCSS